MYTYGNPVANTFRLDPFNWHTATDGDGSGMASVNFVFSFVSKVASGKPQTTTILVRVLGAEHHCFGYF